MRRPLPRRSSPYPFTLQMRSYELEQSPRHRDRVQLPSRRWGLLRASLCSPPCTPIQPRTCSQGLCDTGEGKGDGRRDTYRHEGCPQDVARRPWNSVRFASLDPPLAIRTVGICPTCVWNPAASCWRARRSLQHRKSRAHVPAVQEPACWGWGDVAPSDASPMSSHWYEVPPATPRSQGRFCALAAKAAKWRRKQGCVRSSAWGWPRGSRGGTRVLRE